MTVLERNELFESHRKLISYAVYKNASIIRAMRLEPEDVSQELAICALKSIDSYDPNKGAKLSTYISNMLQYKVLEIYRHSKRNCRVANSTAISLDCAYRNEDGEEQSIEIPETVEYESNLIVKEALSTLIDGEKEVLAIRMSGAGLVDKRQKKYMDRVQKKFTRYYRLANM